jgi:hypothetical protein
MTPLLLGYCYADPNTMTLTSCISMSFSAITIPTTDSYSVGNV